MAYGLGFRAQGLGFRDWVWVLGFRFSLGCRMKDLGSRVYGPGI